MPTVEELYQNVLGRAPENPEVVADWQSRFGESIDPQDVAAFVAAAQAEKPGSKFQVFDDSIKNYIAENIKNPELLAEAARTYGLSASDIERASGYTPTQQAEYLGSANISPLQQLTVEQMYKDVLGRDVTQTPEDKGLAFWKQKFGETIDPSEIAQFRYEAAPELVTKSYQDVLGRAADTSGTEYWTNKLRSGEITADQLGELIAKGSVGAQDRIAAQKYLNEDYFAPTEFLTRTGGMSYQDVVDYISQNISDPTKVYQTAQQYGINPNDVMSAMQTNALPQLNTLSDVERFFQQGQQGFGQRYEQILEDTFGSDEERARIEQILGMKAGDLEKLYDPSQFSRSSIEKIEETLQSTRVNKIQDALITKAIAKDVLGYTDEEMKTVVSDLAQGKEDDPILRDIFDSLKSGNRLTKDEFESLMIEAAKENPDAEIFKRKPELAARYTPIEPKEGVTGQYGYYNNAPVLNMSALDRYLKDSNQTKLDLGEGDLGWATNSKYMGEVRNGAAVFGVKATPQQVNEFDRLEDEIRKSGGLQTVNGIQGFYRTSTDPETGQKYQNFVSLDAYGYDPETGRNLKQEYQDTRSQLENAAQKLNIDPSKFGSTKQLFDAVQDASKDLYLVVGRAQGWDPEVAKQSGITVTDGSRGGVNHAAVLYQRFGDKGIALQAPKSFGFDDPKTKSFWQEIASVPFVAELALLNPATAAWYPAIKGAQAAIQGGDVGDILKNVALSYAGQNIIPNLAPEITASIGNTLIEGGIPYDIAGTLADAGARVALNTGMSVLAGADVGEAAERSLLNYGISKGVSGGLSLADFPKEYQPEVARLLSEGIVTGNFSDAAKNAVLRYGGNQLKGALKDVNKPMSAGPTLQAARGGLAQASQLRRIPRRVAPIRRDVRKLIPLRKSGLAYFRT